MTRIIEYDSIANLVAAGVPPASLGRHPRAFPGQANGGYVPDPPAPGLS